MAKHGIRYLAGFAVLLLGAGLAPQARAQDEEGGDNAGQVWAKDEKPETREEAEERGQLGSSQVRTTKKWGAGFRYGHVFFDPHALGVEGFYNFRAPNFQLGGEFQYAAENLVDSFDEEPMTDVSTLKLKRRQFVLFGRWFFWPESYLTAGLGFRQTTVNWEVHERLGTGDAHGTANTSAFLLDLRIGQQWSFRKGWYVTFEPVQYSAPFGAKTRHSDGRSGARSAEVDERVGELHAKAETSGRKPNWEIFNLCAGKMF